jgi:hypothetical protein
MLRIELRHGHAALMMAQLGSQRESPGGAMPLSNALFRHEVQSSRVSISGECIEVDKWDEQKVVDNGPSAPLPVYWVSAWQLDG